MTLFYNYLIYLAVLSRSSFGPELLLAASLRQRPAEGVKVLEAMDHLLTNCVCEIKRKLKRGETGLMMQLWRLAAR